MRIWIGSVACLLVLSLDLAAQQGRTGLGVVESGDMAVAFSLSGANGIQNAPYSADMVEESIRVLPDGNRIRQESHGKMYRDSQGRTRDEIENVPPAGMRQEMALRHVTIFDPVQGTMSILHPRERSATVAHFQVPQSGGTQTPAAVESSRPTERPMPPVETSTLGASAASGQQLQQQRRGFQFEKEELGTKEIEGVTAVGTRITRHIPAHYRGNDKPMVEVSETWLSPELKIVVLSKTDDPEGGHHIRKLLNIQQTEPDPALFEIPADYAVKEQEVEKR